MRRLLTRLSPALHLTRITTAFAAVANVWFVVLWTRANPEEPGTQVLKSASLWLLLPGSAVNAIGLFGFAMALNDVLDARRDAALNPDRPIPSGRLGLEAALSLIVGCAGAAILGATVLGMPAVLLTLVVAAAILFFNAAGRFVPGVGLVVLGLIYAGQMVVPNLHLRFVWPVWFVMTHALAVGAAGYMIARRGPGFSARAKAAAVAGWAFWSAVILGVGWFRNRESGGLWPSFVDPWTIAWIAGLVVMFIVLCWKKARSLGRGPRVADKIGRYGALWLSLYSCGWLLGQGNADQGLILAALAAAGLLGMTVVREVFGLLEQPLAYRR